MGLEDFIDKAKDALAGATDKVQAEAATATANAQDVTSGIVDKAKELLTDENVAKVAEKIKEFTPDSVDSIVDKVADKAQELNDRFE